MKSKFCNAQKEQVLAMTALLIQICMGALMIAMDIISGLICGEASGLLIIFGVMMIVAGFRGDFIMVW